MNKVTPNPTLPGKVDAPGFLPRLLDLLRDLATGVNGLIEGRLHPWRDVVSTEATGTNDLVILVRPTGPMTVTIPDVASMGEKMVYIKRANNTVHTITVAPAAGLIDGAASVTLTAAYQCRAIFADKTNYHLIF